VTAIADRPVAVVLAGHNGSGKSTLWYDRLSKLLKMPLVNADRLMLSILPFADPETHEMPVWAQDLRDHDERWQRLSQEGVQLFLGLIMNRGIPFAFETVFSHYVKRPDGSVETKIDQIRRLQRAGYFVVLLFVGLASAEMSVLRVQTRRSQGGHDVPYKKLLDRYPRTQKAIALAAPIANMTLMFDNSRGPRQAFSLVRVQRRRTVLYDCRDPSFAQDEALLHVAMRWLPKIAPNGRRSRRARLRAAPLKPGDAPAAPAPEVVLPATPPPAPTPSSKGRGKA
jgi:predicted ABC-type ATPase